MASVNMSNIFTVSEATDPARSLLDVEFPRHQHLCAVPTPVSGEDAGREKGAWH